MAVAARTVAVAGMKAAMREGTTVQAATAVGTEKGRWSAPSSQWSHCHNHLSLLCPSSHILMSFISFALSTSDPLFFISHLIPPIMRALVSYFDCLKEARCVLVAVTLYFAVVFSAAFFRILLGIGLDPALGEQCVSSRHYFSAVYLNILDLVWFEQCMTSKEAWFLSLERSLLNATACC